MSYVICEQSDPRSLISAFVVCCLDSVMSPVSVTKILNLMLASVAEQASLSLTSSETPEHRFCQEARIDCNLFQVVVFGVLPTYAV